MSSDPKDPQKKTLEKESTSSPKESDEKDEETPTSSLTIEFLGPGSSEFGYQRQNVSSWQLASVATTLKTMAELEIQQWYLQKLARDQNQKIQRPRGIILPKEMKQ